MATTSASWRPTRCGCLSDWCASALSCLVLSCLVHVFSYGTASMRVPVAVHMLCGVLTPQRWCSTYSCIEPSNSSSKYINRICTSITMVSLVITYRGSRILDRGSWILSGSAWICFRLAWWHFRLAWWIGEQYSRSSITVTRSPLARQYH